MTPLTDEPKERPWAMAPKIMRASERPNIGRRPSLSPSKPKTIWPASVPTSAVAWMAAVMLAGMAEGTWTAACSGVKL
jgi:hypothetical protein